MKKQTAPIPATGPQRRSSRVSFAVPLLITIPSASAKVFVEETATLSISCHGCRYFSRKGTRVGTKVALRIVATTKDGSFSTPPYPARVIWRQKSRRLDGLYQIGVEFDRPLNLWNLDDSPEDWKPFLSDQKPAPKGRIETESAAEPGNVLAEADRLLLVARGGTHYQLLDIDPNVDRAVVKRRFYHLAQRFHPDRNMDHPEWTPRLLVLMDALATAYRILSDDEAKQEYDSSLAHKPNVQSDASQAARKCLEKAQECLTERNYVGSILWLRRAIDNEPDTSGYRAMLARSLASIPEYRREAVEQFEKAIELDPDNITAHIQYGELLEQMKLPSRARAHYAHVLELVMDHREAREHLHRLNAVGPRNASRSSLLNRLTGRH